MCKIGSLKLLEYTILHMEKIYKINDYLSFGIIYKLPDYKNAATYFPIAELAKGIYFLDTPDTPPDFLLKLRIAIWVIDSREVGHRLLSKIGMLTHPIIITYGKKSSCTPFNVRNSTQNGVGSASLIRLQEEPLPVMNIKNMYIRTPFFIQLAHELIHGYHNAKGQNQRLKTVADPDVWTNEEEQRTIAGMHYQITRAPKISENAIRSEHGLPQRHGHVLDLTPLRMYLKVISYRSLL